MQSLLQMADDFYVSVLWTVDDLVLPSSTLMPSTEVP